MNLNRSTSDAYDLRAIYETSKILSASLDLQFVLQSLILTLLSKTHCTRGIVLLLDPVHQAYRVVASKGIKSLHPETMIPIELVESEQIPQLLLDENIILALPIQAQDRQIGLIGLNAPLDTGAFSETQLEFIHALIGMASPAIHNALMVDELQQANKDLDLRIQKLNTLFDLSTEFSANLDKPQLLKLLSFSLMGQLLVGRYLFLLRNENQLPPLFDVVTAKGTSAEPFEPLVCQSLQFQKQLVLISEMEDSPWDLLQKRGISLVIPLLKQNEVAGVLCLGPKMNQQPFSQEDVEFLSALGNLTLTSLENASLLKTRIEKERLDEEMRLASSIQQRLMPSEVPQLAGVDLAFMSVPTRKVGGDYVELVQLDEHRLLLAIGDVTGKGMPAALLMANLQSLLQMLITERSEMSLATATQRINRVITKNTDADKFITFFWGIYDTQTNVFSYINAGHDAPILLQKEQVVRPDTGGLLLGVLEETAYEMGEIKLNKDDVLLLFTDGLTEAMNPQEQEFGETTLLTKLKSFASLSANDILDLLYLEVQTHIATAEQSDDITLVVLRPSS